MRNMTGPSMNSMVTNGDISVDAGWRPASRESGAAPLYASLEASFTLGDVHAEWSELFAQGLVTPYQSFEFLSAWSETVGKGLEPMVVVARDSERRPVALLPFGIAKRGPLRVAMFLGGRESNFNFPILRFGVTPDKAAVLRLLKEAAKALPAPPDLYDLRNQPRSFDGAANPLLLDGSQPSPSWAYGAHLPSEVRELEARISKDSRKKLRKKEARLAELGEIQYEHQANGERAKAILDALIAQKSKRLAAANIISDFEKDHFRTFLARIASSEGSNALELHALTLSGKIIATYAGLARRGRFSAMLNSYDMDEDIARCSPGELLLHALLRNLISRGFSHFDLGVGEARYKNAICDETIELYDTIVPVTAKGALAAPAFSLYLRLKRAIKQNPALARIAGKARSLVRL
jgi:CelD/BcsL family acetyltransferase involved in cellulose biosynthesis